MCTVYISYNFIFYGVEGPRSFSDSWRPLSFDTGFYSCSTFGTLPGPGYEAMPAALEWKFEQQAGFEPTTSRLTGQWA